MINFSQQKQIAKFRQSKNTPFQTRQTRQERNNGFMPQQIMNHPPSVNHSHPDLFGKTTNSRQAAEVGGGQRNMRRDQKGEELDSLRNQFIKFEEKGQDIRRVPFMIEDQEGKARNNLSSDNHLNVRTQNPSKSQRGYYCSPLTTNLQFSASHLITNTQSHSHHFQVAPIPTPNPDPNSNQFANQRSSTGHQAHPSLNSNQLNHAEEIQQMRRQIGLLEGQFQAIKQERDSIKVQLVAAAKKTEALEHGRQERENVVREEKKASDTEWRTKHESDRLQFQCRIKQLQNELSKSRQLRQPSIPPTSFDEALKTQILKNEQLRHALLEKSQQLASSQNKQVQQLATIQSMGSQLIIQQLKITTSQRSQQLRLQMQTAEQASSIQSLNKQIQLLEGRYRKVVGQVQVKDEFIVSHLVKRGTEKQQQDIGVVLEEYKAMIEGYCSKEGRGEVDGTADGRAVEGQGEGRTDLKGK